MTIVANTTLNSRSDMITAIRSMQIDLGRPVCSAIDDQSIAQQVVVLQKYLSTVPAATASGFAFDPAKVQSYIADTALPAAVIFLQTIVGGTAPVVAIPAVSLPVAPAAFYGTVKLSGWSGNCCDVVRASDSTSQTIGFANGQIDMAAATTFAGGSALSISKWYDQSGNGLDATQGTAANRPNLNALNVVNGIQAIGFDGSNGAPLITKQLTLPAGVALDISNFSAAFVGRQTASGGTNSSIVALSIAGATSADWRVFQGPSFVATGTQTASTYPPTNPLSMVMSRGLTSGTAGGAGMTHYLAERSFIRPLGTLATSGTSAGGIIGNTTVGTERGFFEAVAIVLFASELSTANATATQTALEAPFASATAIQRVFTDTVTLEGDSICLGTGTTLNQNSSRQIWPLLKRPTRMMNAGVFGATMNSLISTGSAHFAIFTGWTQTNQVYVLEPSTNDFATATSNQGLSSKPTIAAGGSGYAASSTFNVTTAGGTGTQAIISVTTNGSGVVTTVNSVSNMGAWSVLPSTPNSPTGGTGTGLQLNLTFAVVNTFAFVKAGAIQMVANAKAGIPGVKVGVVTCLPRSTWIGTPQPWVEAQAYNTDLRNNPADYGYDFLIDAASDTIMGDINKCSDTNYYADGLHPNNGGWVRLAPLYATAINAILP